MKRITIYLFVLSALALFCKGSSAADWQAASCQAVLQNQRIEARFQAGLLYHLTDRATGNVLLSLDPKQLPADYPLFGSTHVDLNSCRVLQQINDNEVNQGSNSRTARNGRCIGHSTLMAISCCVRRRTRQYRSMNCES